MTKPVLRKSIAELARMDVDFKTLYSIIHEPLDKQS